MTKFNDHNDMYIDGAKGGWSNTLGGIIYGAESIGGSNLNLDTRIGWGESHAGVDIATMIKNLARDKNSGVITESIKVIAHSMGAAYAKGLISKIVQYAKDHPSECQGLSIAEYDFAAFQQNNMSAIPGTSLSQYDNAGDGVAGGIIGKMNNSFLDEEEGAEHREVSSKGGHSIFDFLDKIKNLQPGTYKFINNEFVQQ